MYDLRLPRIAYMYDLRLPRIAYMYEIRLPRIGYMYDLIPNCFFRALYNEYCYK